MTNRTVCVMFGSVRKRYFIQSSVSVQFGYVIDWSSMCRCVRFIRALHIAGANMNAVDRHQQTALHIATIHANVGNVNAVIACGAHVNQPDLTRQSALHLAAKGLYFKHTQPE